jgi:type I restriction enzyme S subunit
MKNWSEKTLDELGYVSRGRSRHRPRDAAHLYGGDYPFIQTGDIKHSNLYITEYSQTYSEAGLEQSRLWKAGTLCITIAANIADTAILSFDACFPDSVMGFVADEDKADTRFIKYLFGALLQKQFKQFTQGAAQDNLSQEKLLSIKFPVPDVTTQRRIANILSAYDDLIENNRRRIDLLEQSARMLYKEWFVSLRFPGHEHVKVKDGVPQGWEKAYLANLVETQYGYTESATTEDVGPKFLRGTDINKTSYIEWSAVPYCTEEGLDYEKYALRKGDIVVIRMADPGKVAIIEKDIKAIFASYLVRLQIKQREVLFPYYLFYTLSDEQYQGFIGNASTGSTRQSASAKLLVDFNFLLPPQSLQVLFDEQITPLRMQINTLLDQNASLRKARDLLLPRLMNGEIPV